MRPLPCFWAMAATLGAPGLRLMLRARLRRGKEINGRLPERRGIGSEPRPLGRLLWIHAASVGETISVLPVLRSVADQAGDVSILFTTGTVTSATLLARRLPELGLEQRVRHRFVPLDVPRWAARFLDHWRPDAAAFVESELWPNLLAACAARNIPTMLVNARMSARSYDRWRRVPGLSRPVLAGFARIQAQNEADAERLRALGAHAVTAPGDLKFAAPALPADAREVERVQALLAGRPVWLAASTHPGEERIVGEVHRALAAKHPNLLTIIAPRHPERGNDIVGMLDDVAATRRSCGEGPPEEAGIWIADTLGELGLLYRVARIVFVGRSLIAPGGGQNPLEPARLGCAVAVGPHTGNFTAAVTALTAGDALTLVADTSELTAWVDWMLRDPVARDRFGEAASALPGRHDDLPRRTAAVLVDLLSLHTRPEIA